MSLDISNLLKDWPFEQGQLSCRFIKGDDGEPRIQVRLDLGLLQMFADGRPDGLRPFDFDSLLEYFEDQLDDEPEQTPHAENPADQPPEADLAEPTSSDPARKRTLTADECRMIREEAEMYYRRYVALMVLEDFDRVVRDTTRNLRAIDFCREHAASDDERLAMEKYRPYIVMMRTRALASLALRDSEPKAAVHALDDGLEQLKAWFAQAGKPQLFDKSTEVQVLQGMRDQLIPKLPISQKTELKQRLARALAEENYELAAILRDELKQLKD